MTDTPNPVPAPPPTATVVTPGFRTSEFWLKVAAIALTALFASGVIPTSGPVATVAAIAATMLGALGYTVARSFVKAAGAAVLALALLAGGTQTACGATSKAALGDAVDCTTADRVKLEGQFGPTVEQAILRATGGDGKIDLPSLNVIGRSLEADGWCVLEKEVARLIASALTSNPSSPAAAAAPLDTADLRAKVSALRAAKFGATRFQLGAP